LAVGAVGAVAECQARARCYGRCAPAMRDWAAELVARARAESVELTGDNGDNGLLTDDASIRRVAIDGNSI
ncbi:MAG: hypothetical protein ACXWYB_10825, partial [Aeromicrobium sp.]